MRTGQAIEVREITKRFRLGRSHAGSLKTALLWWKKKQIQELEVLRGLSFDVNWGETVALVGRNGAGKSTMLSLVARVYKPSSGTVKMNGRVAPLLELGAGFHPDLSGRENVFFNGVILGLTRKEILARTPSIIDFAEISDNHIDAPVRTYSSGMLARLGFAVAVHVDADILIVDEVLAVGDFAFEQKCYARIEEFKAAGGAILFVSHQYETVSRVADRCLWLHEGRIFAEGPPSEILPRYQSGVPISD